MSSFFGNLRASRLHVLKGLELLKPGQRGDGGLRTVAAQAEQPRGKGFEGSLVLLQDIGEVRGFGHVNQEPCNVFEFFLDLIALAWKMIAEKKGATLLWGEKHLRPQLQRWCFSFSVLKVCSSNGFLDVALLTEDGAGRFCP